MSKVVLVTVNAKYVHSSLAVWVLAGSVKEYARLPHDVSVIEVTIHQSESDIANKVAVQRPDVVGISTYIWNASKLPGLLKLLRELLADAVFVLGGPEASFNAEYWLDQGADYVLRGEGEYCFPALLDAIGYEAAARQGTEARHKAAERQDQEARRGAAAGRCVWNRQGTSPCFTTDIPDRCPTDIPRLAVSTTYPADLYFAPYLAALGGRIAYVETSRGCPFRCAFCLSAGDSVRFFSIDTAKEQLYELSKTGTHTIKLVDRTFNCNADRAFELFEYIIGLDTTACFHFEVAADLFDEQTLGLLASAPPGRIQLEAGLQSFFEPALKAVSRKTDLDKAERCIRFLVQGMNIHIHVDLIAGLPYETIHDFEDSFNRAYSLGAHTLQLGFLKLLHGSLLRREAKPLGIKYSEEPPYEIQNSPWLSKEDIQILKQAENALQHTYNKCRFLSTLKYVLSASKRSPFSLYRSLGETVPNHGTQLDNYAMKIFDFCKKLPGVDKSELRDRMIIDLLGMVKGKNIPELLKHADKRSNYVAQTAKERLSRKPERNETAVLSSGKGVFVDNKNRDPVTGLYKVNIIDLH